MSENRSHGKIDALPDHLKKQVEEKLMSGETYEDIASFLQENGEDVHFSSVGRYGRKFLNKFQSVRIATEYAGMLAKDNVDRPATEIHEANNLLASQLIMQALVDDDMDPKERSDLIRSIASLQRAQVSNENLKLKARKERGVVHTAMELLKDKVWEELGEAYPDVAAKLLLLAENTEEEMERMEKSAVTPQERF